MQMPKIFQLLSLFLPLALYAGGPAVAEGPEPRELRILDSKVMLRSYFSAGSKMKGPDALGGFASSDNFPRSGLGFDVEGGGVQLRALTEDVVPFREEYEGFRVVLLNRTHTVQGFQASDSRLSLIREAKQQDGKWRPIEYLSNSWCGNSYHRVFLKRNDYWEFVAPRYAGTVPVRMRFLLRMEDGKAVYSNEFDGWINPTQYTDLEEHNPTGIMDPYVD